MQITVIVIRFATRGEAGKDEGEAVDKTRIYSPIQVSLGAFVAGPTAAVYFVWANFKALGRTGAAKQTLIWGIAGNALLLAALPFVPDKFPRFLIPLMYSLAARYIAETMQLKKEAIAGSDQYRFHSNWNVFLVGLGQLVLWIVIAFGLFIALDALGIYTLE